MGGEEPESELIADLEMLRGSLDAVYAMVLAQQRAGDLLGATPGPRHAQPQPTGPSRLGVPSRNHKKVR